jgi:5-methylcytosine-specific restriction endonuclease McrA
MAAKKTPASKSRSRRGGRKRRGKGTGEPKVELTSHPTSRNAYMNTRVWLLEEYGPFCAYCGTKHAPRTMTLDHVAPRRGQVAYDRRDNLVLACRDCNALKRDLPPLAFLLSVKSRAANLIRYGKHLSAGLLDLARPIAQRLPREKYGPAKDDEESPYKD